MENDGFTTINFSIENLDIFYVRTSILLALKKILPKFSGNLLDIGCGKMPYKRLILESSQIKSYTGIDIENSIEYDSKIIPDFTWDGDVLPFESDCFDCSISTEVLEHCPKPETFLKEAYRVLKPGGMFFFTVPFLWNLHEVPHDEYRYTPFSLERHLKCSGFKEIEMYPLGGWHASMAQMLGLWLRRAPMNPNLRKILSYGIKPVFKYLLKKENFQNTSFREGEMITGLYGIAKK